MLRNITAAGGSGMGAGNSTTSVMGKGIDFDGINDRLINAGFAWTAVPVTVTAWNNVATAEVKVSNLFGFTVSGTERLATHAPWSDNTIYWDYGTCCGAPGRVSTNYTSYRNKWTHVGLVSQGTGGSFMGIYLDGSLATSIASSDDPNVTLTGFSLGSDLTTGGNHHDGRIDEFRIASVARAGSWISTERNNQSNPTGFYNVSAEELISDGRQLPSTLLPGSDYAETYEEENPTKSNQNAIPVGDSAEWDFVLQNNGGLPNTNYCFRMVYEDGSLFNTYSSYPRLITNAPPLAPLTQAPFDNERLASTTPWFEFAADDALNDDVSYQIQVSTASDFASTVIDTNSIANFALFTNLSQPAQKSTFTSGETIQFIPASALSNNTTYYWRVRANDPDGSGADGDWSVPASFTINTATTITTWFQTTAAQFATNNLLDAIANVGTNDTGIDTSFTVATTTSTVIDYDDRDAGNAWGALSFTQNISSGSIRYYIQYRVSGENFALVPDTALPGNSTGFTASPVSLVNLNTTTYNELRIQAVLSGSVTLPRLEDWTVTWSETIDEPTPVTPFDNAKVATTTPAFTFYTSDPENNDLQYEFQLSSTYDFAASSTFLSGVDAGFVNTQNGGDSSPFTTDNTIRYTAQSALTNGNTYWWRVRARDPLGSNSWSVYSEPNSITIDTAITTSIWHQTTGDQFATGNLNDIETTAGGAQITSVISEVIAVYGEGTGQAPQYRLWNGSTWSAPASAESVGAQIKWLEVKPAPTRPEYALATLGTDLDVNVQIYDVETDTWADLRELEVNSVATDKRTFNLAYETNSGDLMALACSGTDAVYSIWNGTSWSATSSIALTNPNNCEFIQVASDPTSDEIVVVFRHNNAGTNDYESMVWNGSAFGSAFQFAELNQNAHEGMAVMYEESGNQAMVAVSNNLTTTLLYTTWNGTSWSATSTVALGDHIEWATLKADVGTDRLALCYVDNDADLGVLLWSGTAWGTFTEVDIDGNDVRGRSIDCEFETNGARDGYLMVAYSDTIGTRYQSYNGTVFSGEITLDVVTDTFEDQLVRAGDGLIHLAAYDDALTPDRIDHSRWNGTIWSARERFSDNASLLGVLPYVGGSSMAPQLYPNFVAGSIRSTPIVFTDGSGPRWDYISFSDTTPGASAIYYRLYYESAPGVFSLVPNVDLPGNSVGFTTSPVDISNLDRTTYAVLQLDAELVCDSGNCPTIQDWSVAWSEGITVSGVAAEYDGIATTTSGTVAVSVNGLFQPGKTGTILGDGTWFINNVTAFPGDTVLVYVDGAVDANEAVGLATYNGVGNITGMELTKRHVTIGYAASATTTSAGFAGYDNSDDEDIFFTMGAGNELTLCVETGCSDARLKIKSGSAYVPGANVRLINFLNQGTFAPATNTVRVSGVWNNQAGFVEDTSTVIFTATSSSFTIQSASSTHTFYNVSFGEATSTAIWTLAKPLRVLGSLNLTSGTLARGTSTITVARSVQIGATGLVTGLATTTFDGSGTFTWGDAKTSTTSSNLGYVVIDGTAKTITLSGSVGAQTVTIGSDDTLNASGSGYNINVVSNWTNNNAFVPQTGTVTFVGTSTGTIARGNSSFNNLSFTGVGGIWSFSTSTLALSGTFTIATGTVTLPTGTTTIGGSFLNTGGTFAHNNGEVRMTSTVAGQTIAQRGTTFLNAFYDLTFSGSGAWTFTETNATTSRDLRISAGSVTFPTGQLTVGGDMSVSGSGSFAHNNGEVVFIVQSADEVRTNGSVFNNVRIKGDAASSWYNSAWSKRVNIIVDNAQVPTSVTDFPVYVNLANLPDAFFSGVQTDGDDIRVTSANGVAELPFELVAIDTVSKTGELHFKANLSSTTDSGFYIYYGNGVTSGYTATSTYGRNNVWTNGYEAVYHLGTSPAANMIDSTSNGRDLTPQGGMGIGNSVSAVLGNGVDFDGVNDYLRNTTFAWTANPVTVTAWNNVATAEQSPVNMFGFTASGNERNATHAPYSDSIVYWDYGTCCTAPGRLTTSYASSLNKWTHVGLVSAGGAGAFMGIYLDGSLAASAGSSDDPNVTLTGFAIGAQSSAGGAHHNGRVDEFRIASVARTGGWIATERNNQASTTSFYVISAEELKFIRSFTDTNATTLGSYTSELGGNAKFPTGILSVGGSFNNDAEFDPNGGTVRFNSTAGAETIDAGASSFATLEFNSASGQFTVTEHATATVAVNLTNVQSFTLASGRNLATLGSFTNAASSSNTTWTGSTLRLAGADGAMNAKTHGGDTYETIETVGDTDMNMWNSSATSYVTASTSSLYSQDHTGVDGDLYIYGNYVRSTGTEYWSYGRDFDGVTLSTSTSRQVDVRIASSSSVGFTNASFNLSGIGAASTTVAAIAGAYSLNATNTTITAEYFTMAGTDTNGFGLRASSTLSVFKDGSFGVTPSRSAITIDGSTVSTNPAAQYYRIGFATTSAGTATNITLLGTSTSFVWFREGGGGIYGEAFDAGDANPGSIRFDDSSNTITVSGTVYADAGVTPLLSPTCNGTTPNVRLVVDGGTYTASTSCNGTTGAYSFSNVAYVGDPKIVVYLNTNGGVQGSVVTKTPTGNITNLHIYANRVITRHQDVSPLSASDMQTYDFDNDSDLKFIAATTSLTVLPNTELFVFASSTFAPGGNVSLLGNGSTTSYEGTLQLGAAATFTATGTETHTLAGRFVMATTSVFNAASSTFVFNATTTGKSITSPNTVSFNNLQFTGVGGGWNITAPLSVQGNMVVATGTVTGTSNITVESGSLSGDGTLSLGGGTVTVARTNTLGGIRPWTFNNLTLGNGTVVGTTTPYGTATTTILGNLTIANAHFLVASSARFDLAGSGTVFTRNGTFLPDTSTFRFSGASASVPGITFYDLELAAAVGPSTYTALGTGLLVSNNLRVGGPGTSTLQLNTNDPVTTVQGSVVLSNRGVIEASNSALLTVVGDWTGTGGTFTGNGGTVTFTASTTSTITSGASSFSTVVINGIGDFTISGNATTTQAFSLLNHDSFTVASSSQLVIGGLFTNTLGGASTIWTGSTLRLFGTSTYSINASTTADTYGNIAVGAGTQIRMWNSDAATYSIDPTGSLYSQDHSGVDGDLYIWGRLVRSTGSDYWSYATDFDGTNLIGGDERATQVFFASGASAVWSGASLAVIGDGLGTTTLQNQGSGTYDLTVGTSATTEWNRVQIRDIGASGVIFTGTPTVTDFSRTDHLVTANSGSAITVGGTAINANEAKNFTNNIFAAAGGVTNAKNVTATGTAVTSWRFTNHSGGIAGEANDDDPAGDPGYLVWDDSAALITVSGSVYSDESSTVSPVCDGVTNNIRLVVAGLTTYDTNCNATTGAYSISGVAFSPLDALTLYINGETPKASNVSVSPISSISNMNLYHDRVVVRHENTDPLTIATMAVWDSSDDADINFTAVDAGTDTLSLPANTKLLIWTGKTFEPNGNVTLLGGGAGNAWDGTLEAQANARFRAKTTESHSVGGSVIFGANAEFVAASSTLTLTTSGAGRTFDVNNNVVHNLTHQGVGSYTMTDATFTTTGTFTQSAGTITFPTGTTTIGAGFNVTSGSFTHPGSQIIFTGSGAGNTVRFNGSVVPALTFSGTGSWNMTDTNATTTGSVLITTGTVTLPTGNFAVGRNFEKRSGTLNHNTADLIMTATSTAVLTASSSDLFAVRFTGPAAYTITDTNITLLDTLEIASGTVTMASAQQQSVDHCLRRLVPLFMLLVPFSLTLGEPGALLIPGQAHSGICRSGHRPVPIRSIPLLRRITSLSLM